MTARIDTRTALSVSGFCEEEVNEFCRCLVKHRDEKERGITGKTALTEFILFVGRVNRDRGPEFASALLAEFGALEGNNGELFEVVCQNREDPLVATLIKSFSQALR